MSTIRYKSIFLFASPQFSGNIIEYFSAHTEKLLVYITMPRFNNKHNIVRLYKKGKLLSEKKVISSGNIFLYYFYWYITYLNCLFLYYERHEEVFVITWQPFFFFGGSLQKMFRKVQFIYWIGDYFPPVSPILKIYENIKKYYAHKLTYVYYLSDRINKKINGKLLHTRYKQTIMWGVDPLKIKRKRIKELTICFIGVIKPSQGIETMLLVIKDMKNVRLKILGASTEEMYQRYKKIIDTYHIEKRVDFPNKMFYGKAIEKEVKDCFLGIALYDVDKKNATYYADPGKIKTYAQYGLPILMTPIADIEKYIKKFQAGEVVAQDVPAVKAALKKIQRNYTSYVKGLEEFNEYFNSEYYYKEKFQVLED